MGHDLQALRGQVKPSHTSDLMEAGTCFNSSSCVIVIFSLLAARRDKWTNETRRKGPVYVLHVKPYTGGTGSHSALHVDMSTFYLNSFFTLCDAKIQNKKKQLVFYGVYGNEIQGTFFLQNLNYCLYF